MLPILESQTEALNLYCLLGGKKDTRKEFQDMRRMTLSIFIVWLNIFGIDDWSVDVHIFQICLPFIIRL